MKVWEICRDVKGTKATKEQIATWSAMNKICPVEFWDALDLQDGEKLPQEMISIAGNICAKNKCGMDCLDEFLESEVPS